jgi:lipoprotein-anchoring transpeptidase ErfK/SrfK
MRGFNLDGSEYVTEDVPYVMYFYSDFAIHGAYWRSSFGYSGSHGCVNTPVGDAAWLYDWAPYGTRVEVHD